MKTSIVLCTYNGSIYIKELIRSLNKLEGGFDELIVCDDNSSDDTISIIEELLNKEIILGKVKIYINEHSLGAYGNFMKACSLAGGDILFFCDQDDVWIKDKVSCMKKIMASNKKINVLAANLKPMYDGKIGLKEKIALERQVNDETLVMIKCKAMNLATRRSGCTMCVRKTYFQDVISRWTDNWAHDDFFWKMAVNDGSLAIINHLSVMRRVHGNNTSINVKRTRENRISQIEHEIEHANIACNENSEESVLATKKFIMFMNKRIQNLKKPNIIILMIMLLVYGRMYRSKSQMLMDIYLTINKRIK
jgi:glycosyltransferase involved in cell wall biosynthesis